jgi:thiol-disulfide isomerase/thioredoxin
MQASAVRDRRTLVVAVFAVAAASAVAALAFAGIGRGGGDGQPPSRAAAPAPAGVGAPAPAFRLSDVRDPSAALSLDDFRGRPLVVNFWASWCGPCAAEMPAFQRVYQRVKDRVAFVGIDHQDTRPEALAMLARTGVRYPVAYDAEGKTATAYGLFGMPTTVFVSPSGRVVEGHGGSMSEVDLEKAIARLFPSR